MSAGGPRHPHLDLPKGDGEERLDFTVGVAVLDAPQELHGFGELLEGYQGPCLDEVHPGLVGVRVDHPGDLVQSLLAHGRRGQNGGGLQPGLIHLRIQLEGRRKGLVGLAEILLGEIGPADGAPRSRGLGIDLYGVLVLEDGLVHRARFHQLLAAGHEFGHLVFLAAAARKDQNQKAGGGDGREGARLSVRQCRHMGTSGNRFGVDTGHRFRVSRFGLRPAPHALPFPASALSSPSSGR